MTKARRELEAPHMKSVAAGRSLSLLFIHQQKLRFLTSNPKTNVKTVKMVKAGKCGNFSLLSRTIRQLLPEVGQLQRRRETV